MRRSWKSVAILVLAGISVWLTYLRFGPATVKPFDAASWVEARHYERFAMSEDLMQKMVSERWTREQVAQVLKNEIDPRIGYRHAIDGPYYIQIVYDQNGRVVMATRHAD